MAQPRNPNNRKQTDNRPANPKQEDVSVKKNPKRDRELSDVDDSDMGQFNQQTGYGTTQGEGY